MLCSLWLPSCQSSLKVTPEEPLVRKSRKMRDAERASNQVVFPDVQAPMPQCAHSSGLSGAISETFLSSAATATTWQQALSTELQEEDTKPAARLTLRTTRSSSGQQLSSLGMRPKRPKTEDFPVELSLQARLETSEQARELLRTENEALKAENLALHDDFDTLKQETRSLIQARILDEAFGAAAWSQYFGEVGAVPPLPDDIAKILNSSCPFWPGKRVKNTHLLALIPAAVDGEPFSLNLLEELIQRPKGGGYPTRYRYYAGNVQATLGDQLPDVDPSTGSYWVLMTRDVLPGSRNETYSHQQALVATHARRTGLAYELPGVVEAATVILSHYVRSGERFYTDAHTRCQELVDGQYPPVVGGFSLRGLLVLSGHDGDDRSGVICGVSGLRKL
jgi:hypothetical protein